MDNCTKEIPLEKKHNDTKVKKKCPNEDIKDFAMSTMNEMLGWYGYGNQRDLPRMSCKSTTNSNSSGSESPKLTDGCGWCGKALDEFGGLTAGTTAFCSETCFSQSRRANFKKNRTCDWCRHIRHTVSYVDFQDGASQLQFCSDKCLNQYKMHIFCRETRAHLELHPHLNSENNTGGLITPDLWMKNCKSSRSPSPQPTESQPQMSHVPLIMVAPSSKLLASPKESNNKSPKIKAMRRPRKRPSSTITNLSRSINDSPQDLRIKHSPQHLESIELGHNHTERSHNNLSFQPPDYSHSYFNNFVPPPSSHPPNVSLPPVTVMVPYPIIIPLPIPIPIPLPLSCFPKPEPKHESSHNDNITHTINNDIRSSPEQNVQEEEEEEEEVNVDVVDTNDVKIEECTIATPRPLTKRKRLLLGKNKILIKRKKSLSV